MTQHDYVKAVLAAYLSLPHTTRRAGPADRRLARSLFSGSVPLDVVLSALLLGTLRRLVSVTSGPLAPVRSLAYFVPIIAELRPAPLDPSYHAYLRQTFLRAAATLGQKPAVSSGR